MAAQPTSPRRRYFQFSLRTLLILVTLAVVLLVTWRTYVEPYRQQRETMALIKELGGKYETVAAAEWLQWIFGDDFQNVVFVDLSDCGEPKRYLRRVATLPRLETLVVGGHLFDGEDLGRLRTLGSLRGLILDSTMVDDGSVGALKQALPNLAVYQSHWRSIDRIGNLAGDVDIQLDNVPWQLRRPELKRHFRYITQIEFEGSNVGDADLACLHGMAQLRVLVLRRCSRISDAGLAHLEGLDHLGVLELRNTKVSDAGLAHLARLSNLRKLDLTNTAVSDAGLVHLGCMTKLEMLTLDHTQVSDAGLLHVKDLSELIGLSLAHTQLSDAGTVHLRGLTNLRSLHLHNTKVSDTGLVHLRGLVNLKGLYLTQTQVTDAGLQHLKGLTGLNQLDLTDTQVSDVGLVHLEGLRELRLLILGYTSNGRALGDWVTDAGIKKLRKALPQCKIHAPMQASWFR